MWHDSDNGIDMWNNKHAKQKGSFQWKDNEFIAWCISMPVLKCQYQLPSLIFPGKLTLLLPQSVKFPGLKVHTYTPANSIWWSYNKSTLNTVHFDRNPFTCSCEWGGGGRGGKFSILLVVLEWWSGRHGSERVKPLILSTLAIIFLL